MELFVESIEEDESTKAYKQHCCESDLMVDNANVVLQNMDVTLPASKSGGRDVETVNMKDMREEAKNLESVLLNLAADVNSFQAKALNFGKMLKRSVAAQDPRVKRYTCEFKLLHPYIAETISDVNDIRSDIREILGECVLDSKSSTYERKRLLDEAGHSSGEEDMILASGQIESGAADTGDEQDDGAGLEVSSGAPLTHQEQNSRRQASKQMASDSNDCDCEACTRKIKFEKYMAHSMPASTKEVFHVPCNRTFTCYLCGVETEHSIKHMKEEHPGEKQFPCQECGETFTDFEILWHHMGIHKLGRKLHTTEPPIQCEVCGVVFKSAVSLEAHKAVHTDEKPYKCEVCGRMFKQKKAVASCQHPPPKTDHTCKTCGDKFEKIKLLREHIRQVHSVPPAYEYPCLLCNESFRTFAQCRNHLDTHSNSKNISCKCGVCDTLFSDFSSLFKHMQKHKKKRKSYVCDICGRSFNYLNACNFARHRRSHLPKYPCNLCHKNFSTPNILREHMNVHAGERPFECQSCGEKFPSTSALQSHKNRKHNRGRLARCTVCGMVFKTSFGRDTHYMKHTQEELIVHNISLKMYECDVCGKMMRREYMARHKSKHMADSEEVHLCDICGQGFSQLTELNKHKFTHTSEQDVQESLTAEEWDAFENLEVGENLSQLHLCDTCGISCVSKASLYSHKATHSETTPHVCPVCGKKCKTKRQLILHDKIHTGNEPFECNICGKKFLFRTSLHTHLNTHTKERSFTCGICGATFTEEYNMQRHVSSVHENQRRFECDFCGKRFNYKQAMQVHRRIHTGEKPHVCDICGQSFSDRSTLCKHKARHERDSLAASIQDLFKVPK